MYERSVPPGLVKISALARLSGVPPATIKHYLREGLLPRPVHKKGTVALYDPRVVERVRAIKDLQRKHLLSLKVIKGVLDGILGDVDDPTAIAIKRVLVAVASTDVRTRGQLIAAGMPAQELDFFSRVGLITPTGSGDDETYAGDDLALLRTLGAARKAGITRDMLPPGIIEPYVNAIRELVRTALELLRDGVVPRAGGDLAIITEAATRLSEQLVVLIRRKMLLPTLRQLVEHELHVRSHKPTETSRRKNSKEKE